MTLPSWRLRSSFSTSWVSSTSPQLLICQSTSKLAAFAASSTPNFLFASPKPRPAASSLHSTTNLTAPSRPLPASTPPFQAGQFPRAETCDPALDDGPRGLAVALGHKTITVEHGLNLDARPDPACQVPHDLLVGALLGLAQRLLPFDDVVARGRRREAEHCVRVEVPHDDLGDAGAEALDGARVGDFVVLGDVDGTAHQAR
ncbi:hypothetical protein PG993_014333 [Apiospora rasikravindrae]|uniref:Uncharacterized protein n=1 Tax=Apiospora rasikravindrae TaxID=990691 RepID=A0ABR1RNL5_9PEZI